MKKILIALFLTSNFLIQAHQLNQSEIAHVKRLFAERKNEWQKDKEQSKDPILKAFFNQSVDAIINDKLVMDIVEEVKVLNKKYADAETNEQNAQKFLQELSQLLSKLSIDSKTEKEAQIRTMNIFMLLQFLDANNN